MASHPTLDFRLFGRFVVVRNGREIPNVDFGGRKVRSLVRILVTRHDSFVSHDALVDMLWGDRPPADPRANLQVLVNRGRRALEAPDVIRTGPGGYAMVMGPHCTVDADEFVAAISAAQSAQGRAALASYSAAFELWRGEPLAEDAYSGWASEVRGRLESVRQLALEDAAEIAMAHDDQARATEFAGLAAGSEPLREAAVLTLVRALAAAGDRAGAITRYEQFRRALADELGVDPSARAQEVQAQLLRGEGPLVPGTRVRTVAPTFLRTPFVGRTVPVRQLEDSLARLGLAFLIGDSGAGKSRVLDELSRRTPLTQVRAYLAEQDEPWSLARGLIREILSSDTEAMAKLPPSICAAIGWLLPEIDTAGGADRTDPESRRALLVEGAVRLLGAAVPALVVDDLQWADAASLRLLDAALARLDNLGVVLAFRPFEVEVRPDVTAFVGRLRPRAFQVELAALSRSELTELTGDRPLLDALAAATDGTPMAILEVLRALSDQGAAVSVTPGRWQLASPDGADMAMRLGAEGQRRAIASRVDSHPSDRRGLLMLLALLAREAPTRLLASAADRDESAVLTELEVLARAGLAHLGERGWAPAHDMIGEVTVARLSDATRARMHERLARALERADGDAGERARHWLGARDPQRAAQAYCAAAQNALATYADSEAIALADAGLAADGSGFSGARLYEARAEARARRGDIAGARGDLRMALRTQHDGAVRARLLVRLATLASGAEDLLRAAELAELALVEAGADESARAGALEIAAVIDMNIDQAQRAQERSDEALLLFQKLSDAGGTARVLDGRAMATFLDGHISLGVRRLRRVADLFEDSGDLVRVLTPRSTSGHGQVFAGDAADGLRLTSQALELARTLGHPEGQTYALWHTAEANAALGLVAEALAAGREALAIAQALGHRGWTATAWRAVGIAEQAAGDLETALDAFDRSLAISEHLNLFASWAAARSALVLIDLGRVDEAHLRVQRALAEGPPLGHYEARLAQVELAAAMGEPTTSTLAHAALRLADAGGMRQGRERLAALATQSR